VVELRAPTPPSPIELLAVTLALISSPCTNEKPVEASVLVIVAIGILQVRADTIVF
jgi:hypothetical protein